MKEKIKGLLAGMIFRLIALLTLGQISPILSACVIIERDGKFLLIDRSDGMGYTILKRDPRFRAVAIAYKGSIIDGTEHGSGEGSTTWREPGEVFGRMAFDCEHMLKDYLSNTQRLS